MRDSTTQRAPGVVIMAVMFILVLVALGFVVYRSLTADRSKGVSGAVTADPQA